MTDDEQAILDVLLAIDADIRSTSTAPRLTATEVGAGLKALLEAARPLLGEGPVPKETKP